MRPHTVEEARAVVDTVEDWQDVFRSVLGPAPGLRRRRVLPARRPPVPRGRGLRGLPPARERHRHGPRLRDGAARRGRGRRRHRRAARLLRLGRRRPGRGLPGAPHRRADLAARLAATPRSPSSPASTAPGARAAAGRLGPADVRVAPGAQHVLRRQHRRHRAAGRRGPRPVLAAQPEGHRYLLPDVCLSGGLFLDGTKPDDLPRPVEIVRHRRRSPSDAAGHVHAPADPTASPSSPSSAGPTSASPRWSTASSAGARPSSRSSPASPATARSSRPSGGAGASSSSTPAAGWPAATASTPRSASRPSGPSRAPTSSCSWPTPPSASPRRTTGWPPSLRAGQAPGAGVANKVDRETARPTPGTSPASAWASPSVSALHGRQSATCSTTSSSRLPPPEARASCRRRRRRRRCPSRRRRRPAQRGQVDAVQPADRRRALGRPRHAGHHPRHHRHGRRDRPTGRCASSTPPACGARARSTRAPSTTRSSGRCRPSTGPTLAMLVIDATEGVTHQDQRLAERIDAAGSPVRDRAEQVGPARRRRPGRRHRAGGRPAGVPRRTRRCSRSAP